MKKQILFLLVVMLALFAGIKSASAQSLTADPTGCPTVIPIACNVASNPLNPIPGTPYDYEVNVTATSASPVFTYDWFVTTDKNFITAGALPGTIDAVPSSHIAAIGTGAGLSTYHSTAAGNTAKINITWQSFIADAANPVFLVIYVKNTATCLTDNIQVYEIKPQPSFTLDLANIDAAGAPQAAGFATCVAPIVSATWAANNIAMNYGENYVYFAVTAANFNHSWKPAFQVSATEAGTATMDVAWAYKAQSFGATPTWHTTTQTGSDFASADVVDAPSNGSVGIGGECIIVRVHIDNNAENTQTDNTISFAVDGIMRDPVTTLYATAALGDLSSTAGAGCGAIDGFTNDKTTQVIMARPTIIEVTPASPAFIPKTN